MARKSIDSRLMPSESNCTVFVSGEEDEVLELAVQHAVSVHGHTDDQELRDGLRAALRDEEALQLESGAFVQLIEFHTRRGVGWQTRPNPQDVRGRVIFPIEDLSGRVVAFGLVDVRPGDVSTVRASLWGGVHPAHRGRGLGRLVDPHPPAESLALVDGFASYLGEVISGAAPDARLPWCRAPGILEEVPMPRAFARGDARTGVRTAYPQLAVGPHATPSTKSVGFSPSSDL